MLDYRKVAELNDMRWDEDLAKEMDTNEVEIDRELAKIFREGDGVIRDEGFADFLEADAKMTEENMADVHKRSVEPEEEDNKSEEETDDSTIQTLEDYDSPENQKKRFEEAKAKVDSGDYRGVSLLADYYQEGIGTEKDIDEAIRLYKIDAENDDPRHAISRDEACNCLGRLYFYGEDVPRDLKEAIRWYNISADDDEPDGEEGLGLCYYYMSDEEDPDHYSKAIHWFTKASYWGWAPSMLIMSSMYLNGTGVEEDREKALEWAARAGAFGDPDGCLNTAFLYYLGYGDEGPDYESAFWWLIRASRNECVEASWLLDCIRDDKDPYGIYSGLSLWYQLGINKYEHKAFAVDLEDCDLSDRAVNCLHRVGIYTLDKFLDMDILDIKKIRNFGKRHVDEVLEAALDMKDEMHMLIDVDLREFVEDMKEHCSEEDLITTAFSGSSLSHN